MNAEEVTMYLCPTCGEEYEDADEALDCCGPPDVDQVTRYRCSECDEIYDTESEAEECCKDKEEEIEEEDGSTKQLTLAEVSVTSDGEVLVE